jgi:acetyl-CoA C-acetyltransferase
MTTDNYPIIVGVAQHINRSENLDDAREPMEMMDAVARAAEADAGVEALLSTVDSLQVVNFLAWSYVDPPAALAERIGASPAHTIYSSIGGETPQRLVNETAQAIAEGRTRVALLAGVEALHSRRLARRLNQRLPWPKGGTPSRIEGDVRVGFTDVEARHGATMPSRVYPLFENAIRAHLGLSIEEHRERIGRLCSRLSQVAAQNPYAWFPRARSADEIAAVSADNRMVCFPYPKLMNAIIETDQAAAVIMTGAATARELGIPQDRWVYLRGCGDVLDKWFISERADYHSSPAIRLVTRRALGMAGLSVDDIHMFDLYSCFPSAVQLALGALGLEPDDPRPLTVTGGLPYAGGPGNNYVMHSIAATVERLRQAPDQFAMVTGLGWFSTKHSAGVYGCRPPQGPWRRTDPEVDQAKIDVVESPPFVERAEGPAAIETYTVCFNREGRPDQGIVVGRLEGDTAARSGDRPSGRFFANTEPDSEMMWAMTKEEFVGRRGRVSHDTESGKNVFRL